MINIFNQLYTGLSTALGSEVSMSSVDTNTPSTYPFVSMVEIDDSIYEEGIDSGAIENFVEKDFEITIYTQQPNKKAKSDALLEKIDNYFFDLGFVRKTKYNYPESDESIYHVIARYTCVCSKNKTIYRR
jgi:hypothetical protein